MNQQEKQKHYELAEKLLSEQNFAAALIVGAIAAILAAGFYGAVTVNWGFSYGFAAAGIGIIVGLSMRYLGRGIESKFAIAASVFTIFGCFAGNIVLQVLHVMRMSGGSVSDVLQGDDFSVFGGSPYSFVGLFFWLIAAWFAVFLVKRPLSREENLALGLLKLRE